MARWRLTAAHYLNVPDWEVEFKETDRDTGRQARKVYKVPRHLNPNDPADHTDRHDGVIVVCHEGKGQPRDIVFIGDPTPDMEPLDAEAEAISAALRAKWSHPIETLAPTGVEDYASQLVKAFEKQISALGGIKATPVTAASDTEMNELKAMVKQLMESNAELQARLNAAPPPVAEQPQTARRV